MRFFRRKKDNEERMLTDGDGHVSWLQLQGYTGGYGGRASEAIPSVAACINLISHTLATLKPIIRKDGKTISTHLLKPLLRNPSRDLSWGGWLQLLVCEYLTSGNAIAVMHSIDGKLQLTYVPWNHVTYYNDEIYDLQLPASPRDDARKSQRFPKDQVLHWRALAGSRDAGFTGRSVVQRCAAAINLAGTLDKAVAHYFEQGCAPSGIFSLKQKLTSDQRKQLETSFRESYSGAVKAGKPMMLHGDASYEAISANARDSELIQQRRFMVTEIARIFGLPLAFLQTDENALTYASVYESRVHLQMALQGYIHSFTSAFSIKFLQEDEELELDTSALVKESLVNRYTAHKSAIESGIYDGAFARQMEGIDDLVMSKEGEANDVSE